VNVFGARDILDRALGATAMEQRAILASLRPTAEDYARVFRSDIADLAREFYEGFWADPPAWTRRPDQTELHVWLATAGDLASGCESSARARKFPGGYGQIASMLRRTTVWAAWELRTPGAACGMYVDGLVCVEDRWIWLPKPWKILERAAVARHASVWSD